MMPASWRSWLRARMSEPSSRIDLPGSLGMLTGQDSIALDAIATCWKLYAVADEPGRKATLVAVRALLQAMQPQCRPFAREIIPWALEWSDRAPLWAAVTAPSVWVAAELRPADDTPCGKRADGSCVRRLAGNTCLYCDRPLPLSHRFM